MSNLVAIVGRPNVGKSTLFNRFTKSRRAIVNEEAGTTRDRQYGLCEWCGKDFSIVDTGGWVVNSDDVFEEEINRQVAIAIEEADVILFVVDVLSGITDLDLHVAKILRASKKNIVLVVNKVDTFDLQYQAAEFYSLGLGDPYAISAEHGLGLGDRLDDAISRLPKKQVHDYKGSLTFALLGRPNVGKSSLANAILGQERVIVSPRSGTTRDSVDIPFTRNGKKYVRIDTAGVKRPGKVEEDLDKFAVIRSADAAKRADVILLLIDASEGLVSQDIHVTSYARDNNKPVVLVVNKWDLHSHGPQDQQNFVKERKAYLRFLDFAPVVFTSAINATNINAIFKARDDIETNLNKKVPSSLLNSLIRRAQLDNEAPDFNGGRLKISYITQTKDSIPTFIVFCNNPNYFHFSYKRYLENVIRKEFGFDNCPIRLLIRAKREDNIGRK